MLPTIPRVWGADKYNKYCCDAVFILCMQTAVLIALRVYHPLCNLLLLSVAITLLPAYTVPRKHLKCFRHDAARSSPVAHATTHTAEEDSNIPLQNKYDSRKTTQILETGAKLKALRSKRHATVHAYDTCNCSIPPPSPLSIIHFMIYILLYSIRG